MNLWCPAIKIWNRCANHEYCVEGKRRVWTWDGRTRRGLHPVRAFLLKPAALGAVIGMAFFGVGMIFTVFAVRAATTAASATSGSICVSPPPTSLVLTAAQIPGTPSDTPSPTVSPTDTTSPTVTTSPSDTTSPIDTTTPNVTTSSSASASDTTSPSPSASSSPATSPSASPSPSPSPTTSPPRTPQLCVRVQTYPSGTTTVTAGGTASFVVWVWSTGADSSNVSVVASLSSTSFLGTPSFAICPSASGATCKIASLPVGQVFELLASVPVSVAAPPATRVAFTATASASGALSFSAPATEVVAMASTGTTLPSSSSVEPPLVALPPIPGTSVAPVNPSGLFPTVSPSPDTGTLGLPAARSRSGLHATVVSSTVPIDARLIGAQLVGLAVLAGAVTIAIMRLSLRRRLPASPAAAAATPATAAPPADADQQD
jgi:hypothetical protein